MDDLDERFGCGFRLRADNEVLHKLIEDLEVAGPSLYLHQDSY